MTTLLTTSVNVPQPNRKAFFPRGTSFIAQSLTFALLLVWMVLFCCALAAASAGELGKLYVLCAPPYLPKEDRDNVNRQVLAVGLKAEAGEVAVIDGLELQLVTRFNIPNDPRSRNPKARVQMLKEPLAAVARFFAAERAAPPELRGAVNFPQLLSLAASQVRAPGQEMIVIVYGSPFYTLEPAFRFDDGFVPSDGHLLVDLTRSVFGTAGREQLLQGVVVHFAQAHGRFANDYTRNAIVRFWALYVKLLGGTMASFATPELATERALRDIRVPLLAVAVNDADSRIQMRKVEFVRPTITATNQMPIPAFSAPQTNWNVTRPAPLPPPHNAFLPATPVGKIGIGAVWFAPPTAEGVDVDLHVKPSNSPELSYKNPQTTEGSHFRDIRSAKSENPETDWKVAWEYIELSGDTDLNRTTIWLNLYRCSGIQVTGTVRVAWGDRVISKPFRMKALDGNMGGDSEVRDSSPYWTQLKFEEFFTALDRN